MTRNFRPIRTGVERVSALLASAALMVTGALASDGAALPGQMGLQTPVTTVGHDINFFHNSILLPIITVVTIFVLILLIVVMVKFNAKANPTPSKTTHHVGLEVAWTVLPVMILIVIAIPSFRLLTKQLVIPQADVTVKVTGKQWYWSYEYPKDQAGGFSFDSLMKADNELKAGELRLLAVDNEAVVPVNKTVRMQVTAADVIHSFAVTSFGIRVDAVPGRLNETWFKAEKEGLYYGQCSKLCGKDHAYMPIAIRVVSQDKYTAWLAESKKKFASTGTPLTYAEYDAAGVVRQ